MDPRALSWSGALRALVAAGATGASAAGLGRLAARALAQAPAPDALVGATVLALGALAAALLAFGCALLAATSCAALAGRRWARTEAVALRIVPGALRRVLAVGLGAGLTLGLGTTALADEVDVGWTITTGSTTQPVPVGTTDAVPTPSGPGGADQPGMAAVPTGVVPAVATSALDAPPDALPGVVPGVVLEDGPGGAAQVSAPTVTVRAGDSLWSITAGLLPEGCGDARIAAAWPLLYAANREVVGPDPGLIHPGDVLTVPAEVTA